MIFKIIKGEILEFDIFIIKKNKTSLIYLIFLRICHLLYKKFQRLLLNQNKEEYFKKLKNLFLQIKIKTLINK